MNFLDRLAGATASSTTRRAVLFDRDGTLIVDVPGNRDPDRVSLMPGARAAVARLRTAGYKLAIVTNQPALAAGTIAAHEMAAIHARIEREIGALDAIEVCPHAAAAGCACRKPAPGLLVGAARRLGVDIAACMVIGDIGSDVEAARRAGARAILVPTPLTRAAEIAAAPRVATTLAAAVDLVLETAAA